MSFFYYVCTYVYLPYIFKYIYISFWLFGLLYVYVSKQMFVLGLNLVFAHRKNVVKLEMTSDCKLRNQHAPNNFMWILNFWQWKSSCFKGVIETDLLKNSYKHVRAFSVHSTVEKKCYVMLVVYFIRTNRRFGVPYEFF